MSKYSANVRIGNWYYDLILHEEKSKQYMRRSKNNELKVQRARQVILSLLKEVPLTFPVVGLSYGAVIQIVSPSVPEKTLFKLNANQGIALAADIDYRNVDHRCEFAENDPVIGTGLMTPCVRNVWTLVSDDRSRMGKELRFGDSFHIQMFSSNPPLYVEAAVQSPSVSKGECGFVVPKLVYSMSTLTRFKVVHVVPELRYETDGMVVPPFEKIAIIQGGSSENLCVETDFWFPTYFGMECEISVHTYRDMTDKRKVDPRNFWSFILSAV